MLDKIKYCLKNGAKMLKNVISLFSSFKDSTKPPLAKMYDQWGHRYDELVAITNYQGGKWIEKNAQYFENVSGKVLDLGCADGFIANKIFQLNHKLQFDGIDFSKKMLHAAKNQKRYQRLIQADLNTGIPAELNSTYDFIIATGFFEFIQDHEKLLHDIHKYLKQNGLLFLTLQKADLIHKQLIKDTRGIDITAYKDQLECQKQLTASGFNILEIAEGFGYRDSILQMDNTFFYIIATRL